MILLPALILYAIAAVLGLWSASLVWRAWHASRLQRRARRQNQPVNLTLSRGKRRLGLAIAIVCVPLSGAVFAFGDSVRREADGAGEDIIGFSIRALVAILGLMGAGAVYIAFRFDPSHGRRRCSKCWYDMSGTAGLRCPECGREAAREKGLFRTRRAPALLIVSALLFTGAYSLHLAPRVYEKGWSAAVPTTALILGLPWWSDKMLMNADASLETRLYDDELWGWQQWLLLWRAERIITNSDEPSEIMRAAAFLDIEGEDGDAINAMAMLKWMKFTCLPGEPARTMGLTGQIPLPPPNLIMEELDEPTADAAREIILAGLGSTDATHRKNAAAWSAMLSAHARPLLPRLIELLKDSNEDVGTRAWVTFVVKDLADTSDEAWAAVRWAALDSADPRLQTTVFRRMELMTARHAEVLATARLGMDDPSDNVAGWAAAACLRVAPRPCDHATELIELMERRPGVGSVLVTRLADQCMNERLVLCIERLLQSADPVTQEMAAWAAKDTGVLGARLLPVLRSYSRYENSGDSRWFVAQDAITAIEAALLDATASPGEDADPSP